MDRITPEHRSWNMSRIHGKDTLPEKTVRSILHRLGYRFRLHCKDLPGQPDIVLPKYHAVIFVHGCYWHRHKGCKDASTPKTNIEFWQSKFDKNIIRDKKVIKSLRNQGWRIVIIWECQVSNERRMTNRLIHLLTKSAD